MRKMGCKFGPISRMRHKRHSQPESLKGESTQRTLFLSLDQISSMEDNQQIMTVGMICVAITKRRSDMLKIPAGG